MKKWKILLTVLIAVLVIFMLLNPSMKQYREYLGIEAANLKRTSNFLIFSTFESDNDGYTKKHLGILSNFYVLNSNVNSYTPRMVTRDTSMVIFDTTEHH